MSHRVPDRTVLLFYQACIRIVNLVCGSAQIQPINEPTAINNKHLIPCLPWNTFYPKTLIEISFISGIVLPLWSQIRYEAAVAAVAAVQSLGIYLWNLSTVWQSIIRWSAVGGKRFPRQVVTAVNFILQFLTRKILTFFLPSNKYKLCAEYNNRTFDFIK